MFRVSHPLKAIALTVLLGSVLPVAAQADQMWKVVPEKSHFGPGINTLVIERSTAKPAGGEAKTASDLIPAMFLVISKSKVYLAIDEEASASASGIRTVDYSRWQNMRLVKIGDNLHGDSYCDFACQSGRPKNRETLTFTAIGADPRPDMGNMVVLNDK